MRWRRNADEDLRRAERSVAAGGSEAELLVARMRSGKLSRARVQDAADLGYEPALEVVGRPRRGALKSQGWWNARGHRFAVTVLTPALRMITLWSWGWLPAEPERSNEWRRIVSLGTQGDVALSSWFHPAYAVDMATDWLASTAPPARIGSQENAELERASNAANFAGFMVETADRIQGGPTLTGDPRRADAAQRCCYAAAHLLMCMTRDGALRSHATMAWGLLEEAYLHYVIGEQARSAPRGGPDLYEAMREFAIPRILGQPVRRNPDPLLREAERASAAGDPEATLAYGRALLRAGRLGGPDATVVAAGLSLSGTAWSLHRQGDGWVLRRMLPSGWQITVAGDPELLEYTGGPAGPAVGWLATPLVHFRTDPVRVLGQHKVGRGVVHGKNLADPKAFASAVHDLDKPERRLLGALTLAADEGMVPNTYGLDSFEEIVENERPHGSDLEGILYAGAAASPADFEVAAGRVEELLAASAVWRGTHQGRARLLWPVNSFDAQAFVPFPEVLAALGFEDLSYGNDSAARASLPVYGSSGTGFKGKVEDGDRRIEWYGEWPESRGDGDRHTLTVWCAGLHPSDQEYSDGVRYTVTLGTQGAPNQVLINDAITNENGLAMVLLQLGLRPGPIPRWS